MKIIPRNILSLATILLAFGFITYFLWRDWNTVISLEWWKHPGYLVFHLLLMIFYYGIQTFAWHRTLAVCGCPLPIRASAISWLIPNLGKYVPGKVFMFGGRIEFCRHFGLRRASTFAALVFEHLAALIAAFPFLCGALLLGAKVESTRIYAAVLFIIIVCLIFFLSPNLLESILNRFLKLIRKKEILVSPSRTSLLGLFVFYLAGWLVYGLAGTILAHALGLGGSVPSIVFILAFVAAWQIGFASMLTPGGLGVREAVFVALLSGYIPIAQGMALALAARLTWTAVEMLGVILGLSLNKNYHVESEKSVER